MNFIGITDQKCCWWLACFSFIRMPPVRPSTRQAARRNRAPAARGSVRGRPASRSGPRTSTTLRAADGAHPAHDSAAQEPGTSSGSSRTSAATSSPLGPTGPGLIALLTEMQTSNLDALEGRTAQGPQDAVSAAVDQVLQSLTGTLTPNPTVPVDIHVPDKKYVRRFCRMNSSTLLYYCSGRRETWSTPWQSTTSLGSQTWCWPHSRKRQNRHSQDG